MHNGKSTARKVAPVKCEMAIPERKTAAFSVNSAELFTTRFSLYRQTHTLDISRGRNECATVMHIERLLAQRIC